MTNEQLEILAKEVLDSKKWHIRMANVQEGYDGYLYRGEVSDFEDTARELAYAVLQYLGKENE